MDTANGSWSLPSPQISRVPTFSSAKPKKHRDYHYTFDVDDNGLDINGFILHTNKHEGKRHKFRVYLDSNENNRFDNDDVLLGRTGLKTRHSKNGVVGILDEDETGQVEVKFKRNKAIGGGGGKIDRVNIQTKSNASMREVEDDLNLFKGLLPGIEGKHMAFINAGDSIANIPTVLDKS